MKAINLLDQSTINKIAAGEVVEGPQSVIKELIENSIDAGATAITVEVKEGGTTYIRVTDNGSGIISTDVETAFLRHATSKISVIEDLEEAITLGFRGEALASIAAVAQVEITTRHKEEELGTNLAISGGIAQGGITRLASAQGTTIIVKNLFYNVPARKKFLKKPAAESGKISDTINRIALGHAHISFQYINNGTTILHTSGNNDPKAAILYVYGKDAADKMIPIHVSEGAYSLTGLLGKPELTRANRNYENLFINGRYIKNRLISSAIEEAYKTRLMVGKFPLFVLHFTLPPDMVDVNVHPAKLEVRFRNDNEIDRFFYNAVSKAFGGKVLIPSVNWDRPAKTEVKADTRIEKNMYSVVNRPKSVNDLLHGPSPCRNLIEEPKVEYNINEFSQQTYTDLPKEAMAEPKPVYYDFKKNKKKSAIQSGEQYENMEIDNLITTENSNKQKPTHTFFNNYKIVGQIFQTYWIVEQGKSMFVIDQHAAHERIIFEDIVYRLQQDKAVSQQLLEPVLLHLSESEKSILIENKEQLEKFGFVIEAFPNDTFALTSMPLVFKGPVNAAFFVDILDILSIEGTVEELYDIKINAIANLACKAAVKGHDRLDIQEAQALIVQLLKLENPFQCPHGRPTIIEMPQYELEKKFKRIQN